ncbi:B3 domain-containing transcription factor VRN1-like isoform X2 [Gastrolobium bilobum]|uniref:B3 domain-containing transcription factor VRN1-like isoform X2 n=1 Tax=Gastrolobium bilobum TaxID=150636 RepID=UPI002AB2E94C|nr:B3 domain-containing transcription factor VRN1-like isoform X2 [Gastrolobium bilobum]
MATLTSPNNQPNKHSSSTTIRFFKIILNKSLENGNLMIPNNFTRRYGDGLPNPMFLKTPDGIEWKVYWTKHDGQILFEKGWKEFASYYSLDHGHLVVFEYEKNSTHIGVHIFDKSALEIDYPFNDHIIDDSVEIELPPCQKKRLKSPMSSRPTSEKSRTGIARDDERSPNPQDLLQHVQTEGSQSEVTNFEMPIIASVKQELDGGNASKRTSQLITPCPGTTGALEEAKKFTSENPFFIINIRQSYVSKSRPVSTKYTKCLRQRVCKREQAECDDTVWEEVVACNVAPLSNKMYCQFRSWLVPFC